MTILFVLIPLSVLLLGVILWAFFWAVSNDQFDDLDSPPMNILRGQENEEDVNH